MHSAESVISYSVSVFLIVFITGCSLNLIKQHYIFQLAGIAFLFTVSLVRSVNYLKNNPQATAGELYLVSLPMFAGISACLISMVLGFWIFPHIRDKFRE